MLIKMEFDDQQHLSLVRMASPACPLAEVPLWRENHGTSIVCVHMMAIVIPEGSHPMSIALVISTKCIYL
jgi:hypothetical protein